MSIALREALVFRAAVGDRGRYIVITTSSFSNALGGFGGAITGPTWAINEIRGRGRRYVFAAALSPPTTARCVGCSRLGLHDLVDGPPLGQPARFVGHLATAGLAGRSPTPVVPLILGDHVAARDAERA